MEHSSNVKSVLVSVIMGFLGFCLLVAILALSSLGNDLRAVVIVTVFLYLAAGFLRGLSPGVNPWLSGLLVGVGASLTAVIAAATRVAFTGADAIILFVLASLPPAMCGANARQLWAKGFRRRAFAAVLLLAGAAVLAAITLVPSVVERMFNESVNRSVPPFSIATLDGRVVHSSDLNGHVTVLTFWATWCAPCAAEMPKVQQAMTRYKDDPAVIFWAVDAAWGGDTIEKERTFSREKGWSLPLAFDSTGAASALDVHYPEMLLILDKEGHVRIIHGGYDASEDLTTSISRAVASLLREKS